MTITVHTTEATARAEWDKPGRRAGLARVHEGKCYIFDKPSDAIGHFTSPMQPEQPAPALFS